VKLSTHLAVFTALTSIPKLDKDCSLKAFTIGENK